MSLAIRSKYIPTDTDVERNFLDKSNRISRLTTTCENAGAYDTGDVLPTGSGGNYIHGAPCLRPHNSYRTSKDVNLYWQLLTGPGINDMQSSSAASVGLLPNNLLTAWKQPQQRLNLGRPVLYKLW